MQWNPPVAVSAGGLVLALLGFLALPASVDAQFFKKAKETVKRGAEAHGARLQAGGFGESRPVADNATPEGKQQNRRVELVRLER